MQKTAFILHGLGGNPQENWFPWLQDQLEKRGWNVRIPQFPHASQPNLQEWSQCFREFEQEIDQHTILIGHSLGATFLLRFLESFEGTIETAVSVAGVVAPMGNNFDALISTFTANGFEWEVIKKKAKHFLALYGDNDPYVPLAQGEEFAQKLDAELSVIPNGGHLNRGSGYTQFPELLKTICPIE